MKTKITLDLERINLIIVCFYFIFSIIIFIIKPFVFSLAIMIMMVLYLYCAIRVLYLKKEHNKYITYACRINIFSICYFIFICIFFHTTPHYEAYFISDIIFSVLSYFALIFTSFIFLMIGVIKNNKNN